MDYSELIDEFIEGKLETQDEDKLFNEMALNRGLRSELKSFIDLELAGKYSFALPIPSVEATSSVFGRLNIDKPPLYDSHTDSTKITSCSFWSRYQQGIFGGITGAAIMAFFILFCINPFVNPAIDNPIANQKLNSSENKPVQSGIIHDSSKKNTIAYIKSGRSVKNNISKNISASSKEEEPTTEKMAADKNNSFGDADIENARNVSLIDKFKNILNLNSTLPDNQLRNSDNKNTIISYLPISTKEGMFKNNSTSSLSNFSVEIKNNQCWTIAPTPTMGKATNPLFENLTVTALYRLTKRLSVGADLRQEYFFLDYRGYLDNEYYKFEQHTNYSSVGIIVRYKWLDFDYFDSFIQGYIGANEIGEILRPMLGFEVAPNSRFGITVGIEGSRLFYRQKQKDFTTDKIGIQYGLKINL